MRRVEAERHPRSQGRRQGVPQRRELLEPRPQGGPGARRSLDQHADLTWYLVETAGVAAGVALEPGGLVVDVVAGVRHHPGNPERSAPDQLAPERGHAALVQCLVRGREIDEIAV